ncbi:MAG: class I SAM-dependent methyltransferase [Candidatus Bathyarchaeia archaeon]
MTVEEADRIRQGFWDEDVGAWEVHWVPIFRRFARDLVAAAGISRGQVALDLGTGTGIAALEAARVVGRGGFVFGIDRSRRMLNAAIRKTSKTSPRNLRFLFMDARHLYFPDDLFDAVVSNCGISFVNFDEVATEAYRVLKKGGYFAYNNWRLKNVEVHRIFGEVLQRHRTANPSATLRNQRTALAIFERYGNRKMSLSFQVRELRRAGFTRLMVKERTYRVRLGGVYDFLDMRFSSASLRREFKELPKKERRVLYRELADGLKDFTRNRSFSFDWPVSFIQAKKT